MAVINEGSTRCSLCDRLLNPAEKIVAFGHFISDQSDPLWRFSDSAMHQSCFLAWPKKEEFRARQNLDYRRVVYPDQTIFQLQENGVLIKVPFARKESPDNERENARFSQIVHATTLAYAASAATVSIVHPGTRANDGQLPSASSKEFLEIFILFSFCLGMLGRLRSVPARNYVLDSLDLFIGAVIAQLRGHETANEYEQMRVSRMTRYMNQVNNFADVPNPKFGPIIDSLVANFQSEVIKKPLPALRTVVGQMLAAEHLATEDESPDFRKNLKIDLGRNTDQASIAHVLKTLRTIETQNNQDIDRVIDVFELYLGTRTVGP